MSEISFADVEGVKLCYSSKGEGFPVILIHGFAKKEFWIGQVSALSNQFKVIWFDNRGVGASDRPNIPYTMRMRLVVLTSIETIPRSGVLLAVIYLFQKHRYIVEPNPSQSLKLRHFVISY